MAQEYKLKGLSSLDLQDGEKREVEVDGIEDGKVLLARVGDKTHAMSSKCTHYGAPLKLGVLTPDGRITCPWHGACFNVGTGDVEDAPALDPLAKFDIIEKNGSVFIQGEEETIKASRRSANYKCSASGPERVVIVGGGSGATGALHGLRESGSKAHITVISAEPYLPIDRTKLSKALIPDPAKLALRPQSWYDDAGITTVADAVSSVDFSRKTVSTASGRSYAYTKLILASGGTPKKLPMRGFKELGNIFVLRTLPHVQAILAAIGAEKGKQVVVVGSSFIGMEVGNALAKDNDVTIVGMESAPLERVMGPEVGKIFQQMLEKNGVRFHMQAGVEAALPSASSPTDVGAVQLQDGTVLAADLVVLGVGVAPATEYLRDTAVPLEQDGSVRVNERFELPGQDGVYAVGDIATYPYHGPGGGGKPVRIEHWDVAMNAGRSVGAQIGASSSSALAQQAPKPFIPVFWSALGAQLRYCGHTPDGWDDYVVQGNKAEGKFAAFYANKGEVVAVASMQMDPVMAKSAELMRRGKMPSLAEIKGGANVLELDLPAQVRL